MTEPKRGDEVTWKSHGGAAHGTVEKKQTRDTKIRIVHKVNDTLGPLRRDDVGMFSVETEKSQSSLLLDEGF